MIYNLPIYSNVCFGDMTAQKALPKSMLIINVDRQDAMEKLSTVSSNPDRIVFICAQGWNNTTITPDSEKRLFHALIYLCKQKHMGEDEASLYVRKCTNNCMFQKCTL